MEEGRRISLTRSDALRRIEFEHSLTQTLELIAVAAEVRILEIYNLLVVSLVCPLLTVDTLAFVRDLVDFVLEGMVQGHQDVEDNP